ncbi:MAG TPA: hypothetical protein VGT03_10945 [Candidatus Acidoferrales bacterium]|nr:hypothetical protein [Candidatus Acidoferrales bacterium]
MSIPPQVRRKFYSLRALALVLMVFAGAIFILRPHNFGARLLIALAIFAAISIVRYSNASVWRARGQVVGESSPATAAKRVGRLAWTLTAVSLIACGVFYFLMYLDQLHGGKVLWPVYAFFVAALALTATSMYVAMRIFR